MTPQYIRQTLAARGARHIDPPRDTRRVAHVGPSGAPVYLSVDERDYARAEAVIALLWLQDTPPEQLTTGQLQSLMSRSPHIWREAAQRAELTTPPLDERGHPLMLCQIKVGEWIARNPDQRQRPQSHRTDSYARFIRHLKSVPLH